MPIKQRTLFLDFGTHEATEIRSLLCGNPLSRAWLAKSSLIHDRSISGLRNLWSYTWGASLPSSVIQQIDLVMVEPFATDGIAQVISSRAFGSTLFINAVVSESHDVLKTLYLAKDSLGHSVYRSKPRLSGRSVDVLNINISNLIELVVGDRRSRAWDKIIVRLNIEGAEVDVLDSILSNADLIDSDFLFMGSLGDIEKCHGTAVLKKYESLLSRFERRFVWFTSNPNSWHLARKGVVEFLQ